MAKVTAPSSNHGIAAVAVAPSKPAWLTSLLESLEQMALQRLHGSNRMEVSMVLDAFGVVTLKVNPGVNVATPVSTVEEFDFDGPQWHEPTDAELDAGIAQSIHALLQSAGWSQKQLASALKMSESQLSRILKKPESSRWETLSRILVTLRRAAAERMENAVAPRQAELSTIS